MLGLRLNASRAQVSARSADATEASVLSNLVRRTADCSSSTTAGSLLLAAAAEPLPPGRAGTEDWPFVGRELWPAGDAGRGSEHAASPRSGASRSSSPAMPTS